MPIDLTMFGTRDAKIIRENEGKTPYELLQLGLSHKAYTRLTSQPTAAIAPEAPPENIADEAPLVAAVQPVVLPDTSIAPTVVEEVKTYAPRLGRTADMIISAAPSAFVQVTVIGPSGIPKSMNEKQARKMVAQNPTLYKIV